MLDWCIVGFVWQVYRLKSIYSMKHSRDPDNKEITFELLQHSPLSHSHGELCAIYYDYFG